MVIREQFMPSSFCFYLFYFTTFPLRAQCPGSALGDLIHSFQLKLNIMTLSRHLHPLGQNLHNPSKILFIC